MTTRTPIDPGSAAAAISVPALHERYAAYRQILASARDEAVDWWYFGTTMVKVPGLPSITVLKAATLMIYRTETLSEDRFAIHWDEVGYFSDYVTDRPLTHWLNPLTGQHVSAPRSFAEGPARYEVARAPDGVAVSLSQPGAAVNSIEVLWEGGGGRVSVLQRERKTRGFPDANGRLPDPGSASGFEAVTELAFLDQWPGNGSAAQGLYDFTLAGAPPWMGFAPDSPARASVQGVIIKARPSDPPNPDALRRLQDFYPEFFARHGR